MRTRLLSTASALVLVNAACAQGSSVPVGVGGSSGATTGASSQQATTAAVSSGAGAGTTNTTGSTSTGPTSTTGSTTTTATTTTSTTTSVASSSGSTCPESPCKLTLPQCGCPSGKACTVDQTTVACLTAGTVGPTETCTGQDQCAAGLLCVQEGTTGICEKFCDSDADCTAPGGLCIVTLNNGMGGSIPNVTLCTDSCNPFTNVGCAATGTSCQVGQESTGQMRWLTFCGGAGTLGKGMVCDPMNNQCAPTYGCFNTGTQDECFQYCQVGSALSCPTCSPLMDMNLQPIYIGTMQVGVCN